MSICASAKIASTAIIEDGAIIGENVEIGHFSVIGANVEIGEGSIIANHATIVGHTKLGKNNKVFTGAAVGVPPQDLKYAGEKTELIIGDHNLIREFTTLNPGTEGGGGVTRIGNHNLLMAYVHIAHDCHIGNHCILANNATLAGHVELGDYVNIGGMSPVHQFVKIGDGAMLGGDSSLVQDLPPFCLANGHRATILGLNKHRMRKLFSSEEVDEISRFYRDLLQAPNLKEFAKEQINHSNLKPSIIGICKFILSATRGIAIKKGTYKDE